MNRRKFLKLTGMSILATAASQILAACGGSGGGAEEPVVQWTAFTVTDTASGTYKVEIEYYHQHDLSAVTALYSGASYSGNLLTYMQNNSINIAGTGGHTHYYQLTAGEVSTLGTVGGTVTVVANTGNSDHTHNVRITKTA